MQKFRAEMEALSRIDHPGIVGLLDAGETTSGKPFLVMQFVEGESLRSAIPREGMELPRAANILRQLGQALSAAHEKGVYHRDLKPENVMLQRFGGEEIARLIDFGIATVRDSVAGEDGKTTMVAGTLHYMAPEQLLGKPTHQSDIYALGVLAYELVTGRAPFNVKSALHLQQQQQQGPRVKPRDLRPDLSENAEILILKALSFDPGARPYHARTFAQELAAALEIEDGVALPIPLIQSPDLSTCTPSASFKAAEQPAVCNIFLSYRKRDATFAGVIYEHLKSRFPGQVFKDIADEGKPDSEAVNHALCSCKILVVVIGNDWLDLVLRNGDMVRREIIAALNDGKPVFAAILPGARAPDNESVPPDLKNFVDRQVFSLTDDDFDRDVERLAEVVSRELHATYPVLPREDAFKVLLSEFSIAESLMRRFGLLARTGIPSFDMRAVAGSRIAIGFFVIALCAALLSIIGHAHLLTVVLTDLKGNRFPMHMGYLYELNAGPMYLTLVPLFVIIAFRFLGSVQAALRTFESDRRLRYNQAIRSQPASNRPVSPLSAIAVWNRKLFLWLLPPIWALVFWLVVWSEIAPYGSYRTAFGYVQAALFPTYETGKTVSEFVRSTGRTIHNVGGIQEHELSNYVIERIEGGPRSAGERAAFILFLTLHLFIEFCFASMMVWFLFKVGFVLWLVLWSIRPHPNHPIELELDLLDPDYCYGLALLNRAWKYLLKALLIGVLVGIGQQITNPGYLTSVAEGKISNGSWTTLNLDVPATERLAHMTVAYFGLAFAMLFICYMILLSSKVEGAKDDAIGSHRIVIRQSFPGDRALTFLALTSPICYALLLVMSNVWIAIARHWDTITSRLIG